MQKITFSIIAAALMLLGNIGLWANASGRVGATTAPSCGGCHGPSNPATFVSISSSTGWTVAPGDTLSFLLSVGNINKVAAGFNAAITALDGTKVGQFVVQSGSGVKVVSNEVTHTAPKMLVGGTTSFAAGWVAPSTPGTYFLRAAGNAVDLTGGSDNDAFNFLDSGIIRINVTGTVGSPSVVAPYHGQIHINTSSSLSWEAVAGAANYYYEVADVSTFSAPVITGNTLATTADISGLQHDKQYWWRVRAASDLSVGEYTSASFTTVPQQPPSLAQPLWVSPAHNTTQVPLNQIFVWRQTPNALDYEWQVSINNFSTILFSGTTADTTTSVPMTLYNTQHRFRVRARYLPVQSSWRTITFHTFGADGPVIVTPLPQSYNVSTTTTVEWAPITPSEGYEFQVATTGNFTPLSVSLTTNATAVALENLHINTQYHWRVRAVGTTMATTLWTVGDFITAIPRRAVKIAITNIPDEPVISGEPFSLLVRGHTSQGMLAHTTEATIANFAAEAGIHILSGSQQFLQQSLTATTITVQLESQYPGITTITLSATPTSATLTYTTAQLQIRNNRATQIIALREGWNAISFFVEPDATNLDSVFGGVADRLILAKNGEGNSYLPSFAINSIGSTYFADGYHIFMSDTATLVTEGRILFPHENELLLRQGWNFISYLPQSEMLTETALASISSSLVIAKDNMGRVFVPQYNIAALSAVEPGNGYWLYCTHSDTLRYPSGQFGKSRIEQEPAEPTFFKFDKPITEHNATLILEGEFRRGDEVGIFNSSGQLCGSTAVQEAGNTIAVTVFGADTLLSQQANSIVYADELLIVERYRAGQRTPLRAVALRDMLTRTTGIEHLTYRPYSVTFAKLEEQQAAVEQYTLFPNPAKDWTTLRLRLETSNVIAIEIYDVSGRKVAALQPRQLAAGAQDVPINLSSLATGIYRVLVRQNDNQTTLPLTIVR